MRGSDYKKNLLVTGSLGQIGSELVSELAKSFETSMVIACDIKRQSTYPWTDKRISFVYLDVTDVEAVKKAAKDFEVGSIYHLAGLLSAKGETEPDRAMALNVGGLRNVLEAARLVEIPRVFWPSSIAVFGQLPNRDNVPQDSPLFPETVYGITKVTGELLCNYYHSKFDLDVRSLRLPGIISNVAPPGGGTTDYAVEIFYSALTTKQYTCFVEKDTVLPMLYMPDCLRAIIGLMSFDYRQITLHHGYNIGGMTFSAEELEQEIRKYVPDFDVEYKPDSRMQIARSWPRSIEDSRARVDWDWMATYNLSSMTKDMIERLSKKLKPSI